MIAGPFRPQQNRAVSLNGRQEKGKYVDMKRSQTHYHENGDGSPFLIHGSGPGGFAWDDWRLGQASGNPPHSTGQMRASVVRHSLCRNAKSNHFIAIHQWNPSN
ncbi:hypothetical protein BCV53_19455 (plasmid) [Parageobacillus thermoglucosidasius]|uniref:Uncharacterized protein n=1 Tax=Parageobacillus thermoglucosidasius TaxID=1426 RepID=A0AAN0YSY4_PARTM|nr:hypothetical protein BCV53_19455 [Parageobacillus thermoglucosidasius]APM83010.1 hypothetical protein BCV54_19475 [Parageobacillus thermoglucosidasius]KJX67425.1 hypothetical protein WH82_17695 [Parageobacillus thermoglucosidasius]RDE18610.1 hypothetical protein DV712_19975 [Parageobacillus thermoglucosidasius]